MPLILNQYREISKYKDSVGERYHFPNRYLKPFAELPVPFIYYEPHRGGEQVYFGTGIIRSVVPDTEDESHSYADVDGYRRFANAVNFYKGPEGQTWEPPSTMRNSVRRVDTALFDDLIDAGGLVPEPIGIADPLLYERKLARELNILRDRRDPLTLRRVRRILEAYERPSWVTNLVKQQRGDTCQLCRANGFVKRDGQRYCEVHHLFHLCDNPPNDCLGPDFVVVVCATCHRRLHYAKVGDPVRVPSGWQLELDGITIIFDISPEHAII